MEKNRIPKYIAIEGPIGVGKTSLAKQISQEFGHELCLEKPDENPFLNSFYELALKHEMIHSSLVEKLIYLH